MMQSINEFYSLEDTLGGSVVTIKKGLVDLTGDLEKGVILDQFIQIYRKEEDWISITAAEMQELTFIKTEVTTRRKIKQLVDAGYLAERRNPFNKWDRTLQYKVYFEDIKKGLEALRYNSEEVSMGV